MTIFAWIIVIIVSLVGAISAITFFDRRENVFAVAVIVAALSINFLVVDAFITGGSV